MTIFNNVKIPRPALNYYGSKWRLAPRIIELIPSHTIFVEPYGGSAAVMLLKQPSYLEVYNDQYEDLVNFFKVLRDQPEMLIRAIKLTPMARAALRHAVSDPEPIDSVERARRFYVGAWLSRNGNTTRNDSGWRYERSGSRGKSFVSNWDETYHLELIVKRLKQIQIECDDALRVIKRFDSDDTVFYVDPPYPKDTRSASHLTEYIHDFHTPEKHELLADVLHSVSGGVILSCYPCALYDRLYGQRGWQPVTFNSRTRTSDQSTEVLWLSPKLIDMRLPLFHLGDHKNAREIR